MTVSIEEQIIKKMKKAKRGSLFFAEGFLRFGSSKSVAKVLKQLVDKGKILLGLVAFIPGYCLKTQWIASNLCFNQSDILL